MRRYGGGAFGADRPMGVEKEEITVVCKEAVKLEW